VPLAAVVPSSDPRRPPSTEPRRRQRVPARTSFWGIGRRPLNSLLLFVMVVLVADALIGDKGVIETMRARRHYWEVARSLDALRRQNMGLRDQIRRLKEDPAAIEALARKELGLIRPGELLFIVKDVPPAR
jgi:cell division protein FtsB